MWDDIIIGKGETGVTTIVVPAVSSPQLDVSANKVCYRVTIRRYDIGATIFKNTEIGQRLVEIENNAKSGVTKAIAFRRYATDQIFKHLRPTQIKSLIERVANEEYHRGRSEKAKEIRDILESD